MKQSPPYWNHNVAYHRRILSRAREGMRVLDVGCGDGLLAEKLPGVRLRLGLYYRYLLEWSENLAGE